MKPGDIYAEHITGTKANRPDLRNAIRTLRDGDQLVVAKLDRLARSLKDLLDLDAEIRVKGASLVILDSNVDTATSHGRLFISIMGAAAEFEAAVVSECTRAALATVAQIAGALHVSRSTIYQALNEGGVIPRPSGT